VGNRSGCDCGPDCGPDWRTSVLNVVCTQFPEPDSVLGLITPGTSDRSNFTSTHNITFWRGGCHFVRRMHGDYLSNFKYKLNKETPPSSITLGGHLSFNLNKWDLNNYNQWFFNFGVIFCYSVILLKQING
jgi:hypothetical protein